MAKVSVISKSPGAQRVFGLHLLSDPHEPRAKTVKDVVSHTTFHCLSTTCDFMVEEMGGCGISANDLKHLSSRGHFLALGIEHLTFSHVATL